MFVVACLVLFCCLFGYLLVSVWYVDFLIVICWCLVGSWVAVRVFDGSVYCLVVLYVVLWLTVVVGGFAAVVVAVSEFVGCSGFELM